jgi:hypothetical protein
MITQYVAIGFFASMLVSTAAQAQSAAPAPSNTTSNLQKAKQIFRDAWQAANQQNYEKACPMFDAAVALEPNYQKAAIASAQCYAEAGQYVTAVDRYLKAQQVAANQAVQDPEMLEIISSGLTTATNRISYVTIHVPGTVGSIPGVSITLNGNLVASSTYGSKIPLNRGNYQIGTNAPNHKTQIIDFKIEGDAKDIEFTLIPLQQLPPSPGPVIPVRQVDPVKNDKPDPQPNVEAPKSQSSTPPNIVVPLTSPNLQNTNQPIKTASQPATIQDEPQKRAETPSTRSGGVALILLGGGLVTGASFLAKEALDLRDIKQEYSLYGGFSVAAFLAGTTSCLFGLALVSSPSSSAEKRLSIKLHSPQITIGPGQVAFQARW